MPGQQSVEETRLHRTGQRQGEGSKNQAMHGTHEDKDVAGPVEAAGAAGIFSRPTAAPAHPPALAAGGVSARASTARNLPSSKGLIRAPMNPLCAQSCSTTSSE